MLDKFINNANSEKKSMSKLLHKTMPIESSKLSIIYFKFSLNFISTVIGKIKFENWCLRWPFSQFVTISDETFALLIFENNYDRRMSMAINDNWTSSDIKPDYTSGGNVIQSPKSTKKLK